MKQLFIYESPYRDCLIIVRGRGLGECVYTTHRSFINEFPRLAKDREIVNEMWPPPCIFCGQMAFDFADVPVHSNGYCPSRPRCIVLGCLGQTCVQALVGGYKPACLHHFFKDRVCEKDDE